MRKGRAGRWRGKETGKGRKRRAVKEGVKGGKWEGGGECEKGRNCSEGLSEVTKARGKNWR